MDNLCRIPVSATYTVAEGSDTPVMMKAEYADIPADTIARFLLEKFGADAIFERREVGWWPLTIFPAVAIPEHWLIAQDKEPLPDPVSNLLADGLSLQDITSYIKDGYSVEQIAAMAQDCKAMGSPLTDPEPEAQTKTVKPKLIRACDVPYEPPRWTLA